MTGRLPQWRLLVMMQCLKRMLCHMTQLLTNHIAPLLKFTSVQTSLSRQRGFFLERISFIDQIYAYSMVGLLRLLFIFYLLQTSVSQGRECPDGHFGEHCDGICHCRHGDKDCDVTGSCMSGQCAPGWRGPPNCQSECPDNWFGLDCSLRCHCDPGDPCEKVAGLCLSASCEYGWAGPSCQTWLPAFSSAPNITAVRPNSIDLAWRAWTPGADAGAPSTVVLGYRLLYRKAGAASSWDSLAEMMHQSNRLTYRYIVDGLQQDTVYQFCVQIIWSTNSKQQLSVPGPVTEASTTSLLISAAKTTRQTRTTEARKVHRNKGTRQTIQRRLVPAPNNVETTPGRPPALAEVYVTDQPVLETVTVLDRNQTSLHIMLPQSIGLLCPIKVSYVSVRWYSLEEREVEKGQVNTVGCSDVTLTNLTAATQYSISTTLQGDEVAQLGLFWTHQVTPPAPPRPVLKEVSYGNVTVILKKLKWYAGPISYYTLTVNKLLNTSHTERIQKMTWNDSSVNETKQASHLKAGNSSFNLNATNINMSQSSESESNNAEERNIGVQDRETSDVYITAKLMPSRVTDNTVFTIGDDTTVGGYRNTPLQRGHKYTVTFCVVSILKQHFEENCSVSDEIYLSAAPITVATGQYPMQDAGFAGVFFGLVALALVVGIIVWRQWQVKEKQRRREVENEVERLTGLSENTPRSYGARRQLEFIPEDEGSETDIPDGVLLNSRSSPLTGWYNQSVCERSGTPLTLSCPLKVGELEGHLKEMGGSSISAEYLRLPNYPTASVSQAKLPVNIPLNRDLESLPYDHNRVKLQVTPEQMSDYINATKVNLKHLNKKYIVTQYPLSHTASDLWQTVWQEGVSYIIILGDDDTQGEELEPFWPEEKGQEAYRDVSVTALTYTSYADFRIKSLALDSLGSDHSRVVLILQFQDWSEDDVPLHTVPLQYFIEQLQTHVKKDGEILVMCPDGGGRCGMFLAIYSLLDADTEVDIQRCAASLRQSRCSLISSLLQYEFIYKFLYKHYQRLGKKYSVAELSKALVSHPIKMRMLAEFRALSQDEESDEGHYQRGSFCSLNGSRDASSRRYVDLSISGSLYDDNHGAAQLLICSLSSYRTHSRFLLMRTPIDTQRPDMFAVLMKEQIPVVIQFGPQGADQLCWPKMGESLSFDELSVECMKELIHSSHIQRHLVLEDTTQPEGEGIDLYEYEFTAWPPERPGPSVKATVQFLHFIMAATKQQAKPVLVLCQARNRNAGLFCLLWTLLEMVEQDEAASPYKAARYIQDIVPNFKLDLDGYKFCYQVLKTHCQKADDDGDDASALDESNITVVDNLV